MTHDEASHAILEAKYARIIEAMSQQHEVSLEEAMDIFYNSPLLPLIEEGVADLHCRSDHYLAEEIWQEYVTQSKHSQKPTANSQKLTANSPLVHPFCNAALHDATIGKHLCHVAASGAHAAMA